MRTEEAIIHKIQELKFAKDNIFGMLDDGRIGIFIRALEWVLEENEDE